MSKKKKKLEKIHEEEAVFEKKCWKQRAKKGQITDGSFHSALLSAPMYLIVSQIAGVVNISPLTYIDRKNEKRFRDF